MKEKKSKTNWDKKARTKNVTIGLLVLLFIFTILLISAAENNWTISGNNVYINTTDAYINVNPHTIYRSGDIYLTIQTKSYTGDIDLYFGVDKDNLKPTGASLYDPSNSTLFYYCNKSNNIFNYTLSPNHFYCYENVSGNSTLSLIYHHSFDGGNIPLKYAYWNETRDYRDLSNLFSKLDYTYDGFDTWYYAENLQVVAGNTYKLKINLKVPPFSSGKYGVAIKPSSETFAQAVASNHFYYLDPWYVSALQITYPSATTYYTTPTELNFTIAGTPKVCWYDLQLPTSTIYNFSNSNASNDMNGITSNGTWVWYTFNTGGRVYKHYVNGTPYNSFTCLTGVYSLTNNGTALFVANNAVNNSRLRVFDMNGTWISNITLSKSWMAASASQYLHGVTTNGSVFWITDYVNLLVVQYNLSGGYISNFSVAPQMSYAGGLTYHNNSLYVPNAISGGTTIFVYNLSGTYLRKFDLGVNGSSYQSLYMNDTAILSTQSGSVTSPKIMYFPSTMTDCGGNVTNLQAQVGNNNWSISVEDVDRNLNVTTVSFNYDTSFLNISLISPPNGTVTNNSQTNFTANLTATAGIANATLNIYNQSNYLINQTTVTYPSNPLTTIIGIVVNLVDGVYTWFYDLVDINNIHTISYYTLTVDTTKPNIYIVSPQPINYIVSPFQLNYTISDTNPQSCWYDLGDNYCYQESANTTNQTGIDGSCGLNYNGSYLTNVIGSNGYIAINYTKPINSVNAIWVVKHGNQSQNIPYNITIPQDCFNYYSTNLSLRGVSGGYTGGLPLFSYFQCYNGTWKNISNFYTQVYGGSLSTGAFNIKNMYDGDWATNSSYVSSDNWHVNVIDSGGASLSGNIYEEAIYWNIRNQSISCGTNISNLQAQNGTNTWIVYANDSAGNINSSSVTFNYLTLGQSINLNSPSNGVNYTSPQSSIDFNYTLNPTNVNITNATIYLYNNTDQSLLTTEIQSFTTNNSINRVQTLNNFGFGNYSWNIYSCGYQVDNLSNTICNFASSNYSFKIVNQTLSTNIYTNRTAQAFNYISIKSNVSVGYGYDFSYCNFSLRNPLGNLLLINNQSTSITNGIVESNQVYLNQSGTYYANVTCYNNNGNYSFTETNIIVPYSLFYQPSDTYRFSATFAKNESNSFDIRNIYDNTDGEVYYNITVDIQNRGNFSISLSQYSLLLNSTENATYPKLFTLTLNASNQIANGTFSGNVTFSNSTYGLLYNSFFEYSITPPSGIATLSSLTGTICSPSVSNACYKSLSMTYGNVYSVNYQLNNTGYYTMSNCNLKIEKTTISQNFLTWTSFSPSNFSIGPNQSTVVTATFSPTDFQAPDRYYSGFAYVECNQGDLGGNPVSVNTTNRPYIELYILMPVGFVSGGGGGGAPRKIYVNVTSNKTFCGDGICQIKGNDNKLIENYYSCSYDCPPANIDTVILGCFDNKEETACAFSQAIFQYAGLLLFLIFAILIFGTTKQEGKEVPLYRYIYLKTTKRRKR